LTTTPGIGLSGRVKTLPLRPRRAVPALLCALALLASGCLEQLTTTRIPSGATENFLYFLQHDEQADANAYWAPDHLPPDAAQQVAQAATRLRRYSVEAKKAGTVAQPDRSVEVTITGTAHLSTDPQPGALQPLLRARLIEIGPGWRLTGFTLLCCP